MQRGSTVQAEDLLQQALMLDPASLAANTAYGDLLLQRQHLPEAMDRFEAALATDPHNPQARAGEQKAAVALALHTRDAGSPEGALLTLQHARASLPDDPTLLLDLGIQAHSMHRLTTAAEALRATLALDPGNAKALYALARVETDQQHFPDAETHFQEYLRTHPTDATAHYGLARVYQMRQQTAQAIEQFQRSLALQPAQTESTYQLGQIALDAHHDQEARTLFATTLARLPTHGGALTGMGILAYRAKNYTEAETYLGKAVSAAPDYQPAHYYRGLNLRRLSNPQQAQRELDTAAQLAASQQDKSQPIQNP